MNDAIAIVSGAIISGIVGVLVVFFQQRLARQHELDTAKALSLNPPAEFGWWLDGISGRLIWARQ